jgi:GT2 family glycosyltransferase
MIAFGASITDPAVYERCAQAGIARVAEPDSRVFAHAAAGSVARSYNLILDQSAACEDLEALVLLHQDAEIVDPAFCRKLRQALRAPGVGLVGPVGVRSADSIAWWDGAMISAASVYRYGELGGGEASLGMAERPEGNVEVDALYGVLMALTPWVVRTVRFDESLPLLFGYDYDLSLQVRASGRRVVMADLEVVHHHSLQLVAEPETWTEAHMGVAEKWDGGLSEGDAGDWKLRARRAEAAAAAARLKAASMQLQAYARAQEHDDELGEITRSASWRLTAPLRRIKLRYARLTRPARGARRRG